MTFYESNRDVRPTGEEPGEYADDHAHVDDDDDGDDPTRRPSGSPPLSEDPEAPA